MIEIEKTAWQTMVDHAQRTFPDECCGAMLGKVDGDRKTVSVAVPIENSFRGAQGERYEALELYNPRIQPQHVGLAILCSGERNPWGGVCSV